MKKMKKVMVLLLSLVMVLAMSIATFADESGSTANTYSLTITGTKEGHKYGVYQIFTGDISGELNGEKVLTNVKYGSNYVPEGKAEGGAVEKAVLDAINADDFAQSFVATGKAFKTVDSTAGSTVISGLPAGYYLVKDSERVTGQDASTKFILQVVGDTSVAVKSDVPTVEKKVMENAKNVNPNGTDIDGRILSYNVPAKYNDVADYNIGDKVPFQLIGTLPSNYDDYDTYKYIFHDTLSAGLTYNDDAKVYVLNGTTKTEITGTLRKVESSGTALR